MKLNISWILLATMVVFASCSYKKKNILFKGPKQIKPNEPVYVIDVDSSQKNQGPYKHLIKIGDRVQIRFLNNYDLGKGANESATAGAIGGVDAMGYLVNYDSTCTLPLIGRVNLVGKDRLAAAAFLEKEYGKLINNPIIDVNITSLTVTILGEVIKPGKIAIDKENTTIVDVIALAGGFKDSGRKDRIKIIRGEQVILVNLKDIQALKSSDIVIHHNDIIYVEPYGIKAFSEPIASATVITTLALTLIQLTTLSLQIYLLTR